MAAIDLSVAMRRWTLVASIAFLISAIWVGTARAADPTVEAVITDGYGNIVSLVTNRSDAPEAFEAAVGRRMGSGLRLDYVYRSHGTIASPTNDPYFGQQWNLQAIGVPDAWTHTDGEGIIVAVLDSGINFTGVDGICAFVVAPYDTIEKSATLAPLNTTASFGHGTHIAGTIAQCTNNGTGVAGIAPGISLMPIRVLADDGKGFSSNLADGIDWAIDHGADVINMSLGADCGSTWPDCSDAVVDAAIDRARGAGIVLVASSGNSALSFVAYPSANPYVVSVGAVGKTDEVWRDSIDIGSNGGSGLDIVAPGVEISAETTNLGEYGYYIGTGTSMATPHVTAAVAEILTVNPALTVADIVSILRYNAVDLGPVGFDAASGWGRLDIGASIDAAIAALVSETQPDPCSSTRCDSVVRVDADSRWGVWAQLTSSTAVSSFFFGNPGDYPFMGDWDGDGVETPGLYRQSDGYVYLRNSNTQGIADIKFFFGNPGDVPIAGDFNGDGKDTVSIYRPSNQTFYIINELGSNDGGLGAAEFSYVFGNPGDKPFVGDFNGDGVETVGLHRESTGLVYFRNVHAAGNADAQFIFGDPGDQIVAGDWTDDGTFTPALFRPSNTTMYFRYTNSQGTADESYSFGQPSWVPVAGSIDGVVGTLNITTEMVATGLSRPLFATAPEGDPRLFVVEQGGSIKILKAGKVLPTPFLRITGSFRSGGEQGLLGMAFHPNFATNGRFYVNYTDGSGATRIVEYRADPTSDLADQTPVRTIIAIAQPAANHNGGMLAFGPDGYLYIGMGDGGGSGDAYDNGQNSDTRLGSVLRLDVDGGTPYVIPASNPYNGSNGARENWLIGLRNPWRFSFDRSTGDLYIADVGQNAYEEVTVIAGGTGAGLNLGWNSMEGNHCFPIGSTCETAGFVPPTIEYGHDVGQSITGGFVYRGSAMPQLRGTYFYGDFVSGMVSSFRFMDGNAVDQRDWTAAFGLPRYSLASFGEDGFGELYIVGLNGTISKIVPER